MKNVIWMVSFTIMLVSFSCKSTKKTVGTPVSAGSNGEWILKYDRGPCFGFCPVYTFYLLNDHNGLINVKANLLAPGWYYAKLDQEEVEKLLTLLEPDKTWHPDLSDQPDISDLPSHHLIYKHTSGVRTLHIQSRINQDLSDLFQKFSHLVSEARWDTTSLRPQEFEIAEPLNLIVQLKENVVPETWIKKYATFGAVITKRITPRQCYYLISKDPAKGASNDLYQYLKRDADVIGVQWDQSISKRQ